jgi:hypothetical protein
MQWLSAPLVPAPKPTSDLVAAHGAQYEAPAACLGRCAPEAKISRFDARPAIANPAVQA